MLKYFVAAMLCCSLCLADDPPKVDPPKPDVPVVVTPPVVVPEVKVKISVPKGVLGEGKRLSPYEFDSTTKCYLSLSGLPEGAKVKDSDWDLDDGPADIEKLSDNKLLAFSQSNPGTYVVAIHGDYGYSKIWFEIKGSGPSPPPKPDDPPVVIDPEPKPVDPNVTTVEPGFRAMIVYDKADIGKYTREQLVIISSTRIREYLTSKCVKSTVANGQQPDWRIWDKNVTVSEKEAASIKAMWNGLKPSLGALPQIAIHENGKGHIFPLPATEDLTLTLLKKYGG